MPDLLTTITASAAGLASYPQFQALVTLRVVDAAIAIAGAWARHDLHPAKMGDTPRRFAEVALVVVVGQSLTTLNASSLVTGLVDAMYLAVGLQQVLSILRNARGYYEARDEEVPGWLSFVAGRVAEAEGRLLVAHAVELGPFVGGAPVTQETSAAGAVLPFAKPGAPGAPGAPGEQEQGG